MLEATAPLRRRAALRCAAKLRYAYAAVVLLIAAAGCGEADQEAPQHADRLIAGDAAPEAVAAVIDYLLREGPEGAEDITHLRVMKRMSSHDMTRCRVVPCPEETLLEVELPDSVTEYLRHRFEIDILDEVVPFCPGEVRIGFKSHYLLQDRTHVIAALVADTRPGGWDYIDHGTFVVGRWGGRYFVYALWEGTHHQVSYSFDRCPEPER